MQAEKTQQALRTTAEVVWCWDQMRSHPNEAGWGQQCLVSLWPPAVSLLGSAVIGASAAGLLLAVVTGTGTLPLPVATAATFVAGDLGGGALALITWVSILLPQLPGAIAKLLAISWRTLWRA